MKLKTLGMAVAAAVLAVLPSLAQEKTLPLAEARAQIGDIIDDPASMTGVMKQLSPEDQTAFLADVNAAIAKMPGSSEERAAKFLNVDKAALKGAAKGNLANLVSEVFATVPPEYLTILNERFAEDLFSRNADASRKYSDVEYLHIATNLLARIESRTSGTDDADVRNAFAIAMLVRASGDLSLDSDLVSALVQMSGDQGVQDQIRTEWLPGALDDNPNYENILASADVEPSQQPDPVVALQLSPTQLIDSLLSDMNSDLGGQGDGQSPSQFSDSFGGFKEPTSTVVQGSAWESPQSGGAGDGGEPPRTDADVPWNPNAQRDDPKEEEEEEPQPQPPGPGPGPGPGPLPPYF
jgi:hypothetical protein